MQRMNPQQTVAHVGAVLRARLCQSLDNAGVDVEEVVAGHARLAGHAGRDDDQLGAGQRLPQIVRAQVALDLRMQLQPGAVSLPAMP
jgi:hypothetical protein